MNFYVDVTLKMAYKSTCNHTNCTGAQNYTSVRQTITEMDWERGIWNAASTGDTEKVKSLIQNSKNAEEVVSAPDNSGYTALHYAARNGHVNICKTLVKHGANINAQTRTGHATPLHKASVGGKLDVVKYLLDLGAIADIQDDDGETALHKAVKNNYTDIATILLEKCPKLHDIEDKKGNKVTIP